MSLDQAITILGCRRGASAREIRVAYRRAVKEGRPDTGAEDGAWLTTVQAAREVLLRNAGPDRRRRERTAGAVVDHVRRRRSTWVPDDRPRPAIDLRL